MSRSGSTNTQHQTTNPVSMMDVPATHLISADMIHTTHTWTLNLTNLRLQPPPTLRQKLQRQLLVHKWLHTIKIVHRQALNLRHSKVDGLIENNWVLSHTLKHRCMQALWKHLSTRRDCKHRYGCITKGKTTMWSVKREAWIDRHTVHPVLFRLEMESSAVLESANFKYPPRFGLSSIARSQKHSHRSHHYHYQ